MTRFIFIPSICILLFSCNSFPVRERGQPSPDTNKVDPGKESSNISTPSKSTTNTDKVILPFDSILRNCMNSCNESGYLNGQTITGMIDCFYNPANQLDSIADQVYYKLYAKLDRQDKQKLKLSKDRWRKFYSAEEDLLYSAFYTWANASKYGHGRGARNITG